VSPGTSGSIPYSYRREHYSDAMDLTERFFYIVSDGHG
jgi:hypothetical protein